VGPVLGLSLLSSMARGRCAGFQTSRVQARNKRIFDKWLACWTQEEIAVSEDMTQQTTADLSRTFTEIGSLAKSGKAAAEHAVDFTVPIFNIWKQETGRE